MGRRALRKIDPGLDLSQHLKRPDELPAIWTSASVFGSDAPLELEVGSGKGLFLVTASVACPRHFFLGMEISQKYARFAAARLARAGSANAKIVHGDAVPLIHDRLPDASLLALHIYFPDPWWKKRHEKRRVIKEGFLADAERVLVAGGQLHFWTDVEEYFVHSLTLIASATRLEGPIAEPERAAQHDLDYRTHFERRMRQSNVAIYRATFRK
jgi:tRNA (guanine-N7-)-methyltransferase